MQTEDGGFAFMSRDEADATRDAPVVEVEPKIEEKTNGFGKEEMKLSMGLDMQTEAEAAPKSPLSRDGGRSEMLYDLYGVVHHQGALSGGHYVASLKSEKDGQWRLYNDAQIYEIHSRDVVDASAYILFYIRRDVK